MIEVGDTVRIGHPHFTTPYNLMAECGFAVKDIPRSQTFKVVSVDKVGIAIIEGMGHKYKIITNALSKVEPEEVAAVPGVCVCPINVLMSTGCKCGGV